MTIALASGVHCPGSRCSVLLTFLLLAALPGCKKDGLTDYQREENKKEERLTTLRDGGAKVTQKNYPPHGHAYVVDLSGAQLSDSTFQNLKDLKRIAELDLSKSSLTDDQMDQLNSVAQYLIKLDLRNTAVTDAGLQKLTNLNLCFDLYLAGTQVTPAGVEQFKTQRLARPTTKVKKMNVQLK